MVANKMPADAISAEMRLIPDVRLINNYFGESDFRQCTNSPLADISDRVEVMGRFLPGKPRRVTKCDIDDSFNRVFKRPDCAANLRTEIDGVDSCLPQDIVFLWLALPFGWSASAGYFQPCALSVNLI